MSPTPIKSRPARKGPTKKRPEKDSVLRGLLKTEGAEALGSVIRSKGLSPVEALTPPGSLLDTVIKTIRRETDCPLEIALTSTFAVLSAALCSTKSTVRYEGELGGDYMSLWLVTLAESGSGKTFVRDAVANALGVDVPTIPTPASGPAFIDALNDCDPPGVGFWDKDEYGQTIKQIASSPQLADLKDNLLQSYDHRTLSNLTRKHGLIEVPNPVLVIFGSTPDGSLGSCLNAEMLVDGFAARHLWVASPPQPLSKYRYNRTAIEVAISGHPTIDQIKHALSETREYVITEAAHAEFRRQFKETIQELGNGLQRGFLRRITHAATSYAVMYHLLTNNDPKERIGVYAARWAWRMVLYHIHSTRHVVTLADPMVANKIVTMTKWCDNAMSKGIKNSELVRKFTQRFSRDISKKDEVLTMLRICGVKM